MIRDFARAMRDLFRERLFLPAHLRAWLRSLREAPVPAPEADLGLHLEGAMEWIRRAARIEGDRGVPARYTLAGGWLPPYPETTGYIVPTLFAYGARTGDLRYSDLGVRLAEWLLSVQLEEGAFPGGHLVGTPPPVVFNTGQILIGLLAAFRRTGEERFLESALRAGRWLASVQDEDGAWRRCTYRDRAHAYHTRVAWPLADLGLLAGEERLLALRLQPWLDTVVFVVDDETLYHRDYEKPVAIAAQFGLTCLCVLNNRGRDRVDLNHPDLKNTRTFFNAASFHVLPDLRGKERFTNELTFVEFKERLRDTARQAPDMPLLQRIGSLSERLLAENQERHEAFQNLEKDVAATVQGLIKQDPDVPLDRILHDDVLAVLSHLGLKRFTVSNIYHFLKRSATTRSVKRSFRLAFGNRRDDGLSQVLRLDVDKLTELIHQRLTDYGDVIAGAIRHHPGAGRILRAAPQLRTIRLGTEEESLNGSLKEIATAFEEECRELVRSGETLSAV